MFDSDVSYPRLRHARTTDENSRDLSLVSQLSGRWGARSVSDGKVVWAEINLDSAPSPAT
ncbi:hypothetical protein OOK58_33000 [Streptomyces sp. NBC_01728]|nr:hypothetical protein [Streptomyces sp. NBC_01728]